MIRIVVSTVYLGWHTLLPILFITLVSNPDALSMLIVLQEIVLVIYLILQTAYLSIYRIFLFKMATIKFMALILSVECVRILLVIQTKVDKLITQNLLLYQELFICWLWRGQQAFLNIDFASTDVLNLSLILSHMLRLEDRIVNSDILKIQRFNFTIHIWSTLQFKRIGYLLGFQKLLLIQALLLLQLNFYTFGKLYTYVTFLIFQ